MKITREDVLRVAELAHLELSEAEVSTYLGQLDSILTYIDKLNELDTSNVEPMAGGRPTEVGSRKPEVGSGEESRQDAGVTKENPALRDDTPGPPGAPIAEAVLKIAPDPAPPYFRVPKVIER